jgi:hypothetical protein
MRLVHRDRAEPTLEQMPGLLVTFSFPRWRRASFGGYVFAREAEGRAKQPDGEKSMPLDHAYLLAASAAVILIGLSKGGFSGLSSLAMPLLSLTISPVRAAAILLPIMIAQDWVGVWAFRRDFDRRNLVILLPSAVVGIALGWGLAAYVTDAAVRLVVGLISIGFVAFMLARERFRSRVPARPEFAPGFLWGSIAGFTSMVSHAGGPPFMVYVLPQRLEPRVFAGTGTMFFAAVNLLKVPPYIALGQFSRENLLSSATLLPVAIAATLAGVWLVRRFPAERFYPAILTLTFLIGLKLTFDAVRDLAF